MRLLSAVVFGSRFREQFLVFVSCLPRPCQMLPGLLLPRSAPFHSVCRSFRPCPALSTSHPACESREASRSGGRGAFSAGITL